MQKWQLLLLILIAEQYRLYPTIYISFKIKDGVAYLSSLPRIRKTGNADTTAGILNVKLYALCIS